MSSNPAAAESSMVLQNFPMMGSTALFMKHMRADIETAATNGEQVLLGEWFFRLTLPERRGTLLHEYLHACLSHPQRAGLMKIKEGPKYNGRIFNVAADAIIDDGIVHETTRKPQICLPSGVYYLSKMVEDLKAVGTITSSITASEISVEELYFLLKKAQIDCAKIFSQADEMDSKRSAKLQAAKRLQSAFEADQDLIEDRGTQDEIYDRIREQTERLKNAQSTYGSMGGSLIERLKGDIPKSTTPWHKTFRSIAASHLSRKRLRNPRRPSGSMLSMEAMGTVNFWDSGRKRSPQPKALVVADSSGSIDMEDYRVFLSELDGIRKRTGSLVDLAVADTKVQSLTRIEEATSLHKLKFEGRGGTCFKDALSLGEREGYDIIIYLSDLDGSFPDKCRVPVIWAVPEKMGKKNPPPFGRLLRI